MLEKIITSVPVKLIFLIALASLIYKLYKACKKTNQLGLFSAFSATSVISVILSATAIGKIYPYGLFTDIAYTTFMYSLMAWLAPKLRLTHLRTGLLVCLLIIATLPATFYTLHIMIVGSTVNADSFIAIFQTNANEGLEYISAFLNAFNVGLITLTLAILFYIAITHARAETESTNKYLVLACAFLNTALLIIPPPEKGLINFPFITYKTYSHELLAVQKKHAEFTDKERTFNADKKEKGETYVVIVGESLNKHHMSLYGYDKETTPLLDKLAINNEIIVAKNAFANYPGTMAALSMAMSQANQQNKIEYADAVGIVELFKKANFTTVWIGNQPLSNNYDMVLGYIANEVDRKTLTFDTQFHAMSHKDQKPDGVLLPHIKEELEKQDNENKIIFVHLMGNHTNYCERYPEEFEKFEMTLAENIITRLFKGGIGHSVECYDNSVYYNDYFVSEVTELLKSHGNATQKPTAMLYFSDHSEDITRGVGHSTSNFSYEMLEIPTIFWVSESYENKYPEKVISLKNNAIKLFSNDFIFDTAIGLANIKTNKPIYCSECDLTSPEYNLPDERAYTMHGKILYTSPDNTFYRK